MVQMSPLARVCEKEQDVGVLESLQGLCIMFTDALPFSVTTHTTERLPARRVHVGVRDQIFHAKILPGTLKSSPRRNNETISRRTDD